MASTLVSAPETPARLTCTVTPACVSVTCAGGWEHGWACGEHMGHEETLLIVSLVPHTQAPPPPPPTLCTFHLVAVGLPVNLSVGLPQAAGV